MKKNRPHPEKSGDASRPRIPVVELYHYNIINTNKKSKIKKNSQNPTISKTQTYNSGYALVFCLLSSVYPQYTAADLSCKITRTGDEADIRKSKRYKRTQKQIHI